MSLEKLIYYRPARALFLILAVFFIFSATATHAHRPFVPVILDKEFSNMSLGRHLEILVDEKRQWTLEKILAPDFPGQFTSSTSKTLNFGFSNAAYWIRFSLKNTLHTEKNLLLEVAFPLIDHVDLHTPNSDLQYTKRQAGEIIPINYRQIQYRNPVFPITLKPGTELPFYLRYQDNGSVPLPLLLWEPTAFRKHVENEQLLLGMYYGSLVIIILYNLVIFLSVRIRSFLYYIIFVSTYLFWQMMYNGLGNEYLWPNFPWLTNKLMPLFICATGIGALQFTRVFLNTKETAPTLNYCLFLLLLCFIAVPILSFHPNFPWSIPSAAFLCIIFAFLALFTGFFCWNKYPPARYFTIAWFVLLCGTAILGLKSFALLPSNFITENSQQIGSVLEMAILSLALADQLRLIRLEKEKAQALNLQIQENANKRLERKVLQRTNELQSSIQQQRLLSIKLSKYLSPQVYSAIFSGKTEVKLHSYRKKLTVFFSDIKGFTQLTDSMESEALTALLNEYLNEMAAIALRYGGTIDKFIGDAIMIFFGDPESRGEKKDALACVLMGIEMRERMKGLQKRWQEHLLPKPLKIRMGINTGHCTVGNFGSEDRLDYTILGGQVNLASRLESLAEPDQILISYQTFALIKDHIACQKIGEMIFKGIAYPIMTYQVIDRRDKLIQQKNEIRETGEGYTIKLDFNNISSKEGTALIHSLKKALTRLEPELANNSDSGARETINS